MESRSWESHSDGSRGWVGIPFCSNFLFAWFGFSGCSDDLSVFGDEFVLLKDMKVAVGKEWGVINDVLDDEDG